MRYGLNLGVALSGVFIGLCLLVGSLGYLTWHLSPRNVEAIQQAFDFEAMLNRAVHVPRAGLLPGLNSDVGEAFALLNNSNDTNLCYCSGRRIHP